MKKIMMLGGNYFQTTAIKCAKELGYYVISVDYLPNNPGHEFSDEYYNVSTLDKEKILELAMRLNIDGILSYASDVSAPTASYVAEKMYLPTNPYETVKRMTRKDLFHPFLKENGFFVPSVSTIKNIDEFITFFENHNDVILKPVNASGSKGVSRVTDASQIEPAYLYAKEYSNEADLVAEEFIHREGYQIAGDAFIVDGEIRFFGLANEHFDASANPLVPVGESFRATLSQNKKDYAREEIQRALTLLGFKNGAVNLDFMFDTKGNLFIIELGPRNGGNLISDAIYLQCGVNLAEFSIKAAVGDSLDGLSEISANKWISSYIFHSLKDGIYNDIMISDKMKEKLIRMDIFVSPGDVVRNYKNGAFGIGAALMNFDSEEEMKYMMDNMNEFYNVILK